MLYRKYYNAQKAIENINTNTSITENQIGFKTLEEIVKAKLISFNPKHKDTLIKAKIVRLGLPMGSFMQSSGGAKQFIGGRLISARNDTIAFGDMDYEYLTNEVDKLKKDRNYQYNLILFITGILLMILGKD